MFLRTVEALFISVSLTTVFNTPRVVFFTEPRLNTYRWITMIEWINEVDEEMDRKTSQSFHKTLLHQKGIFITTFSPSQPFISHLQLDWWIHIYSSVNYNCWFFQTNHNEKQTENLVFLVQERKIVLYNENN